MQTDARATVTFTIGGPIEQSDLPGLCERVCAMLQRAGAGTAVCDVSGVEPNVATVEALARLQLAARRNRCQVRLRRTSPALRELIAFLGLADVLPE